MNFWMSWLLVGGIASALFYIAGFAVHLWHRRLFHSSVPICCNVVPYTMKPFKNFHSDCQGTCCEHAILPVAVGRPPAFLALFFVWTSLFGFITAFCVPIWTWMMVDDELDVQSLLKKRPWDGPPPDRNPWDDDPLWDGPPRPPGGRNRLRLLSESFGGPTRLGREQIHLNLN